MFMILDCEFMILGTVSVVILCGLALKCTPPGNTCGVFLLGAGSMCVVLGHMGAVNNCSKHCEFGLVVRKSQENSFSLFQLHPERKPKPVSFILWSEFLFFIEVTEVVILGGSDF